MPRHPELQESHSRGIVVVCLPPNTVSPVKPVGQEGVRTFKAHYAWHSLERMVKAMEGNPDGEDAREVWKDDTTEDAAVDTGIAVNATGPKQQGPAGENCRCWQGFPALVTEPIEELGERRGIEQRRWGEGFQDNGYWRNSRAGGHHSRGMNRGAE